MRPRLLLLAFITFLFCPVGRAQQTSTGNLTAAGGTCVSTNCVTVSTAGFTSATFSIGPNSAFAAMVQFQFSANGGSTFNPLSMVQVAQGIGSPGGAATTSTTVPGIWQIVLPNGTTNVRMIVSAYTSGTVAATISLYNIVMGNVTINTGGGSAGVSSLNSLTGSITLAAGSNVTLTPSGQTITIASSGGGGGGSTILKTNGTLNGDQTTLNFVNSTVNGVGLAVTASNPVTNAEKFEITGGSYTGNAATATALAGTPSLCSTGNSPTGILANGNATGCAALGTGNTTSTTLTTNTLPKANGANSIINSSVSDNGTTVSTTEGITAASITTSGAGVAGYFQCTGGTAPSLVASAIQIACPASVTTNYQFLLPAVSATGFLLGTNAANVNTLSFVNQIPIANVGSAGLSGTAPVAINSAGAISVSAIPLPSLATEGANTTVANVTSGTAVPTAVAIPSGIQNYVAGTGYNQATGHQLVAPIACPDTSASATTYTCTTTPSFTPAAGDAVLFSAVNQNNSGASTLNVDGAGAKPIKKWQSSTALALGDLLASAAVLMTYDGTNWELESQGQPPAGGGSGLSGMTAGQVPIAATATTVTSSEALAGAGAGITTGPTSGVTTLDVTEFTGTGGQIADSGVAVANLLTTSSTLPLNKVVSPTGAISTFADGNNPLIFNCALTSGTTCLTTGETTAASTAGAVEHQITTLTTSTAIGEQITQGANGPANANAPAVLNVSAAAAGGLASASNAGGVGAPIFLLTGAGSAGGATTGIGGAGGAFSLTTGAGGAAGGTATNNGGNGGAVNWSTGAGGPGGSGAATAGSGGSFVVTLGAPGTNSATGTAGTVGQFQVTGSAPASTANATGVNAGTLFLISSVAGGASSNAAGIGGIGSTVTIDSGIGGAGTGTNAVGGPGGNINLTASNGGASLGTGVNSNGGNIAVTVGSPGTGGSGTAGKAGVLSVTGPTAGGVYYTQGSAPTTANTQIPANSRFDYAPTSITASFGMQRAGAAPVNNNSAELCSNASPSTCAFAKMSQIAITSGAAYTNATTTFSNIVGGSGQTLSFSVEANTNYMLDCSLLWSASAATAGPKFQITGPATPTAVQYAVMQAVTATTDGTAGAVAFSTSLNASGTTVVSGTNEPATITMGLVNGANAGTVTLQAAAQGVGTLTIQPGSFCQLQ